MASEVQIKLIIESIQNGEQPSIRIEQKFIFLFTY